MQEFKVGQFYSFAVEGINEVNGQKYIFLSDGQVHTYRVKAYDFQTEWETSEVPEIMNCYISSVDIFGRPFLVQSRKDVLGSCYSDINTEYPFKVIGLDTDPNTSTPFLRLKDPYGLEHRYYPTAGEPSRVVTDIFSLKFTGIETGMGNKAHLNLKYPVIGAEGKAETQQVKPIMEVVPSEVTPEVNFGVENDEREFKSTIVFPGGSTEPDIDKQMQIIVQTIAGFQNKNGGELYIGVNDSGNVCGISHDFAYLNTSNEESFTYQSNTDGYELKIRNAVKRALGNTSNAKLVFEFKREGVLEYCIIRISVVLKPVYVYGIKLFQRAGNMTQMLRGDEISWFVEERLKLRNQSLTPTIETSNDNIETTTDDDDYEVIAPENKSEVFLPEEPKEQVQKIWYYLTFYKGGSWSFQKHAVASEEVAFELPLMACFKNEPLMMAYENGCVNAIIPNDLINPKRPRGPRKLRNAGHLYQNGWNTNSKLLNVFSVKSNDLVVFKSLHKDGNEHIKIHYAKAIAIHGTPHLEGNKVINPKLNACPLLVKPLSMNTYPLISSLILKDYQTSGYLGIRSTEKNYHNTVKSLNKLLEQDYV